MQKCLICNQDFYNLRRKYCSEVCQKKAKRSFAKLREATKIEVKLTFKEHFEQRTGKKLKNAKIS